MDVDGGNRVRGVEANQKVKSVLEVEALLPPTPALDAMRAGIRALDFEDLRVIVPALDAQIERAESDPKLIP